MKLTDFNNEIQSCFSKINKDYIDLLYFGKKCGMEVAICKGIYEAFLVNVNKGKILATLEINTTTGISKKFNTFEEASRFVMSQDQYINLEIFNFCNQDDGYGYIVNMNIPLKLSNERIINNLLNKIQ